MGLGSARTPKNCQPPVDSCLLHLLKNIYIPDHIGYFKYVLNYHFIFRSYIGLNSKKQNGHGSPTSEVEI